MPTTSPGPAVVSKRPESSRKFSASGHASTTKWQTRGVRASAVSGWPVPLLRTAPVKQVMVLLDALRSLSFGEAFILRSGWRRRGGRRKEIGQDVHRADNAAGGLRQRVPVGNGFDEIAARSTGECSMISSGFACRATITAAHPRTSSRILWSSAHPSTSGRSGSSNRRSGRSSRARVMASAPVRATHTSVTSRSQRCALLSTRSSSSRSASTTSTRQPHSRRTEGRTAHLFPAPPHAPSV